MTVPPDTRTTSFPAGRQAPAEARSYLRDADLGLDGPTLTDLTLLISEAVTNAVRHAGLDPGDPIDLTVSVSAERIHARISQGGEAPPPPDDLAEPPSKDTAGGWGLVIIDRIAERWGVETSPASVWFELRRSGDT